PSPARTTPGVACLRTNPNGLVPPLEEDGFFLGDATPIVRFLAAKCGPGRLEPSDLSARGRASSWMDWHLTVAQPSLTPVFWGLIRTSPEKRDHAAIEAGKVKAIAAMRILDGQLAKTAFVAGETFSMGDIPVGASAYRFRRLIPERPQLANLERWFAGLEQRPAFKEHIAAIPFV